MKNVHERLLDHPVSAVRPWIEKAWSATDDDVFPRDVLPTWRKNPAGADPLALLPSETQIGHGPFAFTLREWDGHRWRVDLRGGDGWHGFDLETRGEKTLLRHTLECSLGRARELAITPVHDWAVESLFDRLETALATGHVPPTTARPMSFAASAMFRAIGFLRRRRARATAAVRAQAA